MRVWSGMLYQKPLDAFACRDGAFCRRRQFLTSASAGFGMLALRAMAGVPFHQRAKAKNIIFCFMDGGPSHVDTFDPKPMLKKHEGKAIGESAVTKRSQSNAGRVWFGSPWEFKQRGQSGLWVSELFPHIAQVADKLCVVRSMVGELPLHGQQNLLLHTRRRALARGCRMDSARRTQTCPATSC